MTPGTEVDQENDVRSIEKYFLLREVTEAAFGDLPAMEMLTETAKQDIVVKFDLEGYEATEEPVAGVIPYRDGGRVVDLGNSRSVTYVAQIMATIRGFRR